MAAFFAKQDDLAGEGPHCWAPGGQKHGEKALDNRGVLPFSDELEKLVGRVHASSKCRTMRARRDDELMKRNVGGQHVRVGELSVGVAPDMLSRRQRADWLDLLRQSELAVQLQPRFSATARSAFDMKATDDYAHLTVCRRGLTKPRLLPYGGGSDAQGCSRLKAARPSSSRRRKCP